MVNFQQRGVPVWATASALALLVLGLACSDADPDHAGTAGHAAGPNGGAGVAATSGGALDAGAGTGAGGRSNAGASGSAGSTAGRTGTGSGGSGSAAGGASGSAAGSSSAGTGGASGDGGVCPGAVEPPFLVGVPRCTRDAECKGSPGLVACRLAQPSFPCGGAQPPHDCELDSQCAPAGGVCMLDSCGGSRCVAACTSTSCGSAARCEAGRCVAKHCSEAGASCPPDYSCDASTPASDPMAGCRPIACDAGYACAPSLDCKPNAVGADTHGCTPRPCTSEDDCACGACVNGTCAPYPGACFNISPPP